eukprot:403374802
MEILLNSVQKHAQKSTNKNSNRLPETTLHFIHTDHSNNNSGFPDKPLKIQDLIDQIYEEDQKKLSHDLHLIDEDINQWVSRKEEPAGDLDVVINNRIFKNEHFRANRNKMKGDNTMPPSFDQNYKNLVNFCQKHNIEGMFDGSKQLSERQIFQTYCNNVKGAFLSYKEGGNIGRTLIKTKFKQKPVTQSDIDNQKVREYEENYIAKKLENNSINGLTKNPKFVKLIQTIQRQKQNNKNEKDSQQQQLKSLQQKRVNLNQTQVVSQNDKIQKVNNLKMEKHRNLNFSQDLGQLLNDQDKSDIQQNSDMMAFIEESKENIIENNLSDNNPMKLNDKVIKSQQKLKNMRVKNPEIFNDDQSPLKLVESKLLTKSFDFQTQKAQILHPIQSQREQLKDQTNQRLQLYKSMNQSAINSSPLNGNSSYNNLSQILKQYASGFINTPTDYKKIVSAAWKDKIPSNSNNSTIHLDNLKQQNQSYKQGDIIVSGGHLPKIRTNSIQPLNDSFVKKFQSANKSNGYRSRQPINNDSSIQINNDQLDSFMKSNISLDIQYLSALPSQRQKSNITTTQNRNNQAYKSFDLTHTQRGLSPLKSGNPSESHQNQSHQPLRYITELNESQNKQSIYHATHNKTQFSKHFSPQKHNLDRVMMGCREYIHNFMSHSDRSYVKTQIDNEILRQKIRQQKAIELANNFQYLSDYNAPLIKALHEERKIEIKDECDTQRRVIEGFQHRKINQQYFQMLEKNRKKANKSIQKY